jgi:uncharacterized protein YndB with AHSA1/START domain/predicted pyridoxine 5'-phosphate oxidase superfamily flavin-nucleotide-binding protein
MTTESLISLTLVRRISSPVAEVFAACTDPKLLMRWLAPGAGGISNAAVDLRNGGCYRLEGIDPDGIAYSIHGNYLDIRHERRIVMSWKYEGSLATLRGDASKVTIELRTLGIDLTELSLTHAELGEQEAIDLYRIIWTLCLDRLNTAMQPHATAQDLQFPGGLLSDIYGDSQRSLQDSFEARALANRVRQIIVASEIGDDHKGFIEARDFFFLSTIDHRGYPTCSHKGGAVGFVRVLDAKTLAFPSYDGNGMFLSMGNIIDNPKIGMLFIDFETPHRVRIHGTATIDQDDALLAEFHGAQLVVRVRVGEVFVNCPRYIHRYQRVATSKYIPQPACPTPIPQWKHIDALQDVLPEHDKSALDASGARLITPDEYLEKLKQGDA